MAEGPKFTHITVSADDDDDFVIQAGAVSPAPAPEPAPEPIVEPAPAPAPAPESEPQAPAAPAPAPAKPVRKADAYQETTLDDLKGEKMSTTQKVVLIAAALGLLAFIAWYFVM